MSGAPPGMSIEAMRKQYEMMDSMNEVSQQAACEQPCCRKPPTFSPLQWAHMPPLLLGYPIS